MKMFIVTEILIKRNICDLFCINPSTYKIKDLTREKIIIIGFYENELLLMRYFNFESSF